MQALAFWDYGLSVVMKTEKLLISRLLEGRKASGVVLTLSYAEMCPCKQRAVTFI